MLHDWQSSCGYSYYLYIWSPTSSEFFVCLKSSRFIPHLARSRNSTADPLLHASNMQKLSVTSCPTILRLAKRPQKVGFGACNSMVLVCELVSTATTLKVFPRNLFALPLGRQLCRFNYRPGPGWSIAGNAARYESAPLCVFCESAEERR